MMNANSPQKGLPGFLRRSIRPPYEESSYAKESSSALSPTIESITPSDSALVSSDGGNRYRAKDADTPSIPPRNFLGEFDIATASTVNDSETDRSTSPSPSITARRRQDRMDEKSINSISSSMGEMKKAKSAMMVDPKSPRMEMTRSLSSPSTESALVKKSYRETEFDKIMKESVVNVADLRRLGWNGIPPHHRPEAWKILLGYLPTNSSRRTATLRRKRSEYRDAVLQHHDLPSTSSHLRTPQEQETLRQVLVDVPRTAPDVGIFRDEGVRRGLERLLHVWAIRHPASSYVQGINDLATPLLAVFLSEYCEDQSDGIGAGVGAVELEEGDGVGLGGKRSSSALDRLLRDGGTILRDFPTQVMLDAEADCYWCLTNLLAGIQDHYTSDQPGVQRMVMRLEELVKRIDAALAEHLEKCGVEFMQFAFRWMNCLLLREFELRCVIRLWDTYLSEGDGGFEGFHVYVCAAFLCQFSDKLKAMQFDEIFGFMQNIPTNNWSDSEIEILLSQAFVLSTLFQGSDAHLMASQRYNS